MRIAAHSASASVFSGFNDFNSNRGKGARRRRALERAARPLIHQLESRRLLANSITIIVGAAGSGTMDSFVGVGDGDILATDNPGAAGTVSTGALLGIGGNTDISITSEGSITFSDLGGTLTLQTNSAKSVSLIAQGASGSVTFNNTANTLATTGGAINIIANTMTLGHLNSGTRDVTLDVFTATRTIDLGTKSAGNLGITDGELDGITAGAIYVGGTAVGGILISAPISPALTDTLRLNSDQGIFEFAAGRITVANLRASAVFDISLPNPLNDVDNLSGSISSNGPFNYVDADELVIDEVEDQVGITTAAGSISITTGGELTLNEKVKTGSASNTVTLTSGGTLTVNPGSGAVTSADVPKRVPSVGSGGSSSPDDVTVSNLVVSGFTGTITDVNVTIDIAHTFDGDLDIFLIGPGGTRVELTTNNGGGGRDFNDTTFDDEAATAITAGSAPFTGSFKPEGLLSAFDGLNPNTTWQLEITDDAPGDIGRLIDWSLTFTGPAQDSVATVNGGITFNADNMNIDGTINAGTNTVTLQPKTAGTAILLGAADTAGTLGLFDPEIDLITAGVVRVGNASAGNIGITFNIMPSHSSQLELITGGQIQDQGGGIGVARLGLTAGTGIGISGSGGALNTSITDIEAVTSTGGIDIEESTGANIGGVNATLVGMKVLTSGTLKLKAGGAITVNESTSAPTLQLSNTTGNIFQQLGTTISSTGDATFDINGSIGLLGHPSMTLSVTGNASFTSATSTINIAADGTGNFGSVTFNAPGDVTIYEDSDLVISGTNTADNLSLTSAGSITDAAGANVTTTADVILSANTTITLNDNAADVWSVPGGQTNFTGTVSTIEAAGSGGFSTLTAQSGTLLVNENLAGVGVNVNNSTLGGTGTVGAIGTTQGTIAPGASPGILNAGNTTFDTDGTFKVELNGTTVGTQYDRLAITGTADLAGAALNVTADPGLVNGNTFTILTTTGALSGTFDGLADNATFTAGTRTLRINYTTNSVILTDVAAVTGSSDTVSSLADGSPDAWLVKRNGSNLEISLNAVVIYSHSFSSINDITVNGSSDNDTFTVDHSGGSVFVPDGISFNGGLGTDKLITTGGTFTNAKHDFFANTATGHSGRIVYNNGSDLPSIGYDGLEPVDMSGSTITNLVFNLPGTADQAILEDDGTAANSISQIRSTNASPTFETTTFGNVSSVTVNMGGDAGALTIGSMPDFTNSLTINGQAGADTVAISSGSTSLTNLTITVGGNITNADANNGTADIKATTASLNVTGAASSVGTDVANRIEIDATTLSATTAGGGIFISDTAGGVAIGNMNAGTGTVRLRVRGNDALTSATVDGTADIVGALIVIEMSSSGGKIGSSAASPLEINATLGLNATTLNGADIFVLDTTGGLAVDHAETTGNIFLKAVGGDLTSRFVDDVADIVGNTVTLATTGAGSTIGTSSVDRLEINAVTLNASTSGAAGDDIFINDFADGLAAGLINAGAGDVRVRVAGGNLTSSVVEGTADIVGANVFLNAKGAGSNIGTSTSNYVEVNATSSLAAVGPDDAFILDTTGGVTIREVELKNLWLKSNGAIDDTDLAEINTDNNATLISSSTITINNDALDAWHVSGNGDFSSTTATIELAGTASFSTITVTSGILIINEDLGGAEVTVNAGTTLGGNGTVSKITTSGKIAPGTSPGTLHSHQTADFTSTASLEIELNGTSSADQLTVGNPSTLNGALNVLLGYASANGDSFKIIDNTSAFPFSGTFTGKAEGATFAVGARTFKITYVGGDNNDVVLTDVTGASTPLTTTYLSDLTPIGTPVNGWGPFENDKSNGEQGPHDGHTIKLAGISYARGLGVHANSELRYLLNQQYTRFVADVGIDDEVGSNGNVIFQVFADGILLFDSGSMTGNSATKHVDVDVTNRTELKLVVLKNGADAYDHADWADARLLKNPAPPPPPPAPSVFLGTLTPTGTPVNGWGKFEVDKSNGEQGDHDGHTIKLNNVTYAHGLGVHANSDLHYAINKNYTRFTADIGIDDEVGANGNVIFQVFADGVKLFDSGSMTGTSTTRHVDVDLTNRNELRLVVLTNGSSAYDHADWADAKLYSESVPPPPPAATDKFLSELTPTGTPVNGFGQFENDKSNGENGPHDGHTITLNGTTYARGLGVHANSDLRYNINKQYSRFTADVGIDDEVGSNGSVIFQVWADGILLFDSGVMTGSSATKHVDVNLTGRSELKLLVLSNGSTAYDHADWADAKVHV